MALTEQERDLLRVIETEMARLDPAFARRLAKPAVASDGLAVVPGRWPLWLSLALIAVAVGCFVAGVVGVAGPVGADWLGLGCLVSLAAATIPIAMQGLREPRARR